MTTCYKCNCPSQSDDKCTCCGAPFTHVQKAKDAIARGKAKFEAEQRAKKEALEAELRRKREIVAQKKLAALLWLEQKLPGILEEAAAQGLADIEIDDDTPDSDGDRTPYKANACTAAGIIVKVRYVPTQGDGYNHSTPEHNLYYICW